MLASGAEEFTLKITGWNRDLNKIVSGAGNLDTGYEYWLVKFDEYDDNGKSTDFTKLEYLYMQMAKDCNIEVPDIELIVSDNLSHFAIKRFDRVGEEKIHMHSLASLVHVNFNEPLHYSYDEALRVVKYMTRDMRAVEEFYKRALFNVIVRKQLEQSLRLKRRGHGKYYLISSRLYLGLEIEQKLLKSEKI